MNPKPGPDGTCSVRQARPRSKRPRSFGSRGFGQNAPYSMAIAKKSALVTIHSLAFIKHAPCRTSRPGQLRKARLPAPQPSSPRPRCRCSRRLAAFGLRLRSTCRHHRARVRHCTPPCCTIFTMLHNFTLAHGVVHQHGDAARGTRRIGGSCTTCRRVCGDATRCTGCTAPFSSTIADRANAVRLYDGVVLRRPVPRAAVARSAAVRVRRFPPRAWCARRLEPGALTARTC